MRTALCLFFLVIPAASQEDWAELRQQAATLVAQGRYTDAVPLLQRVLDAQEKELGADDPTLAPVIDSLAAVCRAQGRNADAEKLYARSLGVKEKAAGPDSAELIADLKPLASLYVAMGRYVDAEKA